MSLEGLPPDQDENSCYQREHARDNANAKSGESKDSYRDKINREQKHSDIFRDHAIISLRSELPPLKHL